MLCPHCKHNGEDFESFDFKLYGDSSVNKTMYSCPECGICFINRKNIDFKILCSSRFDCKYLIKGSEGKQFCIADGGLICSCKK